MLQRRRSLLTGETLSTGGVLLALNPDGSLKWQASYGRYPTAPAIGGDGTIYFSGYTDGISGPIYALNPGGSLKWEYDDPNGGYVRTPPAIGLGHRVYAGSVSGFFAIGP
jgi:outer membrane protein assembly factor BamB